MAVTSVVAFHAFPERLTGGFVGVDVFFVLSGFLISGILLASLERGDFSLRDFYARRVRRIFPALAVALAACLVMGWIALLADEYATLGTHVAAGAAFGSNLLLWRESGYFDAASESKPLLHLWSLGIEEQFYLAWPLLLWAHRRLRLPTLPFVAALAALSFGLGAWTLQDDPVAAFYAPHLRVWELLVGALIAAGLRRAPAAWGAAWLRHALAVAGLVAIALAAAMLTKESSFPGAAALAPTLGTAALIVAGARAWPNRLLATRPFVLVGLISYPLYLFHWPLLAFARVAESETPSVEIRAAAIAISVAAAAASTWLIERPLRFGGRPRVKVALLAATIAALGLGGLAVDRREGVPTRAKIATINQMLADVEIPQATRESDGSCAGLDVRESRDVVCLKRGDAPDLFIAGDSHAMALNAAAHMGLVDRQTLLYAVHGCPPLDGFTIRRGRKETNRHCREVAPTIERLAGELDSIRTVVLASRGPFYFGTVGMGEEGRSDRTIAPLEPGPKRGQGDMFVEGYAKTIRHLLSLGKKVVFVVDWPELGQDPRGCLFERPFRLSRARALSPCTQPREDVLQRQSSYRKLVRRLKAEVPELVVFDTLSSFCDKNVCRGRIHGKLLYFDDDHLSPSGSARLLEALDATLR